MATLLVSWLACQPVAYFWNKRLNGHCDIDPAISGCITGALSICVDLWYVAITWYILVSNVEGTFRSIQPSSALACSLELNTTYQGVTHWKLEFQIFNDNKVS